MAIIREFRDRIFTITLHRPERLNALDSESFSELLSALLEAEGLGAKVVVIKGSKGTFCSGADLVEFGQAEDTPQKVLQMVSLFNRIVSQIRRMDSIVVALIQGKAIGGGFSLAIASDLVVASESALFNPGYMRIAFTPDGGATYFLTKAVGGKKALEMFLLCEDMTAREAQGLGLVNFVFDDAEFEVQSGRLIERLRDLPDEAALLTKRLLNEVAAQDLEGHLEREKLSVVRTAQSEDFRKRLRDFLQKRRVHRLSDGS
ncbi:MAG: 2-(1,2-epoxy-1,2-dihydrophenyl)acetyl-CoA isomerase [Deltaproteobacteria bacterium]|nr:MAG: 2-(1,2-epoxy-1,2-dihydrophenyl)acetyl-CoA isomerase [Deltaproteobacteria bacterium]